MPIRLRNKATLRAGRLNPAMADFSSAITGTFTQAPGVTGVIPGPVMQPFTIAATGTFSGQTNVHGTIGVTAQDFTSAAIGSFTAPNVPSTVTGVTSSALSDTSILISWSAAPANQFIASYFVYRSTDNVTFTSYGSASYGTNQFTDPNCTAYTLYYYYVVAQTDFAHGRVNSLPSLTTSTRTIAGWNASLPTTITVAPGGTYNLNSDITGTGVVTQTAGTPPAGMTIANNIITVASNATPGLSTSGNVLHIANSAQADWLSRISGTGVVWYHSFDTDSEVNQFRFNNDSAPFGNDPTDIALPGTCVRDPTGGVDGGGALKLTYPVGSRNGSAWGRPFSPFVAGSTGNGKATADPGANGLIALNTWNPSDHSQFTNWRKGFYGSTAYTSDGGQDGQDYYVQFRFKLSSARYLNTSSYFGGDGGKLLYLDHVSGSNQELVWNNNYAKYWSIYTDFGVGLRGPNNQVQPGSAWPQCGISDPPSSFCFLLPADQWFTSHWHVILGRDGVTESVIKVELALSGQTSYFTVFDYSNLSFTYSQTPRGHNCFIASNYFNGATCTTAWSSWYDQVIFSRNPIPCPQV